ncbi:ABC transporter permease subunit [Sulfurovum lithotrophicum]|uniref:ABC transporter permease subunit n=1 Tax=Sulfurovum lithotrophicum TaxID=206403 RepID=UPI000B19C33D|nr:ABC transporter permease subunit [Sulfurovum lithotrophicum]
MLKRLYGFKGSLLPGLFVSFFLLGFALLLFMTLLGAEDPVQITRLDERVYGLLEFTLYQAFLSTLLSLAVGIVLAWSLAHQSDFKGRSVLVALFSSSLVLPTLLVAFGLIGIYGRNGWINQISIALFDHSFGSYLYGLSGILLAHTYLNASFASRSLLHTFESIPKEKYKLAKSLGFSTFQRFIYVELPALKPTLLSIASTIFLLCFSSFAIVLILGGSPAYNTLEVAIYEAVRIDFDIAMALKLALIQLAISTLLVIFSSNFRTGLSNLKTASVRIPWKEAEHIGWIQRTVIALFTLFFVLPLLVIIADGSGADFGRIFAESLFVKSFLTSLVFAVASSILTVVLALFLSDAKRHFTLKNRLADRVFSKPLSLLISFSGNLYLAIPSLVMGLGFFLLSQKYEAPIVVWASAAVLTANVLMSLPFALSVLSPVMQKTAQRYDKLVFSLNLGKVQRWIYCEYPYLKSSIGYVFALAFCFSLGDLGIIALFGSDEFSTLPWYLYQLMGSYRTNDAAGVALILLVIILSVFVAVPRLFERKVSGGEVAEHK